MARLFIKQAQQLVVFDISRPVGFYDKSPNQHLDVILVQYMMHKIVEYSPANQYLDRSNIAVDGIFGRQTHYYVLCFLTTHFGGHGPDPAVHHIQHQLEPLADGFSPTYKHAPMGRLSQIFTETVAAATGRRVKPQDPFPADMPQELTDYLKRATLTRPS